MAGGLFKIAIGISLLAHAMGIAAASYFLRPSARLSEETPDQPVQLIFSEVPEPSSAPQTTIAAMTTPDPPTPPAALAPSEPRVVAVPQPLLPKPVPKEVRVPVELVKQPMPDTPAVAVPPAVTEVVAPAATEPKPSVAVAVATSTEDVVTGAPSAIGSGSHVVIRAQPNYRKNTERVYPVEAVRRHEQGLVVVVAVIDSRGHANEVALKQSSGFDTLDNAALRAVRSWEFEPARMDGQAVESQVEVPVNYKLAEQGGTAANSQTGSVGSSTSGSRTQ